MEHNFIRCPSCKKAIPTNSNYCYLCGEPVSELAIDNEKVRKHTSQLFVLNKLAQEISDSESLKVIKSYVELIGKNK